MNHSSKFTWACVVVVVVALVLALASSTPAFLLFILPCAVMIGAMLWMMRGGMGGGPRGGGSR